MGTTEEHLRGGGYVILCGTSLVELEPHVACAKFRLHGNYLVVICWSYLRSLPLVAIPTHHFEIYRSIPTSVSWFPTPLVGGSKEWKGVSLLQSVWIA